MISFYKSKSFCSGFFVFFFVLSSSTNISILLKERFFVVEGNIPNIFLCKSYIFNLTFSVSLTAADSVIDCFSCSGRFLELKRAAGCDNF